MAISRLSTSSPAANTNVLLYTRVGSRVALASVIATNKGATSATLRVWVVPNGQDATPANHAYIAYDSVIDANDSLETLNVAETEFTAVQEKANSKASTFLLMGA